jgi:hypothetical protein
VRAAPATAATPAFEFVAVAPHSRVTSSRRPPSRKRKLRIAAPIHPRSHNAPRPVPPSSSPPANLVGDTNAPHLAPLNRTLPKTKRRLPQSAYRPVPSESLRQILDPSRYTNAQRHRHTRPSTPPRHATQRPPIPRSVSQPVARCPLFSAIRLPRLKHRSVALSKRPTSSPRSAQHNATQQPPFPPLRFAARDKAPSDQCQSRPSVESSIRRVIQTSNVIATLGPAQHNTTPRHATTANPPLRFAARHKAPSVPCPLRPSARSNSSRAPKKFEPARVSSSAAIKITRFAPPLISFETHQSSANIPGIKLFIAQLPAPP